MNEHKTSKRLPLWLLLCWLALVMFMPRSWEKQAWGDSLLYMDIAKEMVHSGDWITPRWGGEAYFNKPPLLFWLMASSVKIFGDTFTSYHVWVGFAGFISLLMIWSIARRLWDEETAFLAPLILVTIPLFMRQVSVVRFSVPLLALSLVAIRISLATSPALLNRLGFWAVLALAFLLKGPIGLIPLPIVFFTAIVSGRWSFLKSPYFYGAGPLLFMALVSPWCGAMYFIHGRAWLDAVFGEITMRFSKPMGATPHYSDPILSFYATKFIKYGPPWVYLLPWSLWFFRKPWEYLKSHGGALLFSWSLCFLLFLALVRPPYLRYLVPLLVPISLIMSLTMVRVFGRKKIGRLFSFVPKFIPVLATFLLVVPLHIYKDRAGDALLFKPWLEQHYPAPRKLGFYRACQGGQVGPAVKTAVNMPRNARSAFLFYLDRDLEPLSSVLEIKALGGGVPFIALKKKMDGLNEISGLETVLTGKFWVLLQRRRD